MWQLKSGGGARVTSFSCLGVSMFLLCLFCSSVVSFAHTPDPRLDIRLM